MAYIISFTVQGLVLAAIQKVAESNRAKSVSLANDICRNYRREGLFFDEILEKAQNGG